MPKAVTRPTRYGPQPGRELLEKQRWNVRAAAREKNLHYSNTVLSLLGYVRPRPETVKGLCELLGCKPEDLYHPEVLAEPYGSGRWDKPAVAK